MATRFIRVSETDSFPESRDSNNGKRYTEELSELIPENFHLTPRGIIESLDLRKPIYKKTASYGHFGRNEPGFSWERTDKAAKLKAQAEIAATIAASARDFDPSFVSLISLALIAQMP